MGVRPTSLPTSLVANGLWNIFTGKKKYTIECGACNFTYTDKVIFNMGDAANSICPSCKNINVWSHSRFEKFYDRMLEKV